MGYRGSLSYIGLVDVIHHTAGVLSEGGEIECNSVYLATYCGADKVTEIIAGRVFHTRRPLCGHCLITKAVYLFGGSRTCHVNELSSQYRLFKLRDTVSCDRANIGIATLSESEAPRVFL